MGLDVEAQARYAYLAARIEHHLAPPASVIELGAAPGDQIAQLADRGYTASAVDIGVASDQWSTGSQDGRMIELFREHGVTYHEVDLERVPYPLATEAYDGVLFTEVFEHLRDYPLTSLHEAARILRPGGYLFFSTPNAASLVNRLRVLRGGSTYTPMADWIGGVIHARHAREYLFSEIDDAMRLVGLTVLERGSRHFHVADEVRWRAQAKSVLDRIAQRWPTLGPQILIVAQKPHAPLSGPAEPA